MKSMLWRRVSTNLHLRQGVSLQRASDAVRVPTIDQEWPVGGWTYRKVQLD